MSRWHKTSEAIVGCSWEMDKRAADLIRSLDLAEHPEGGYFREVFRSSRRVLASDDRGKRSALTTIYFLVLAIVGVVALGETTDLAGIVGIALIVAGVVILNLFSDTAVH